MRFPMILSLAGVLAAMAGCNQAGTEGEACYGNDTCNDGLACRSGFCVQLEEGLEGSPCYGNGTCNEGLSCEADVCVADPTGQDNPVDDNPVDDNPIDDNPVDDNPVDDNPVDDNPVDNGPPPSGGVGWLETVGNHIYDSEGTLWVGRGANIHDTRGCGACAYDSPRVDEVIRRIDALVDDWGADFMRLDLESYGQSEGQNSGMTQYGDVLTDPEYLDEIRAIVDHVGEKPGVYIMLSLWIDPSFSELGWPTDDTIAVWETLAQEFANDSHVLFGLVNEPEYNYDGAYNQEVWTAMNDTVAAIRAVEDANQAPYHVVAVQGVGGWSRHLGYYVDNPITAGDGVNVAYEIHVYDPQSEFEWMLYEPAQTLPVIVGEYGPAADMTETDCDVLQDEADSRGIPHLAWTFHQRCPPNLLVDNSSGGCGVDMPLQPTAWGELLMSHLQAE